VVLEMAGGHVFDASLKALAPFGRLVTYGIASGEPNTVGSQALMGRSPVYPLSDARRAHEDLRARRTVGKLVRDPAS
jgi:NADPH2:quinone reductase